MSHHGERDHGSAADRDRPRHAEGPAGSCRPGSTSPRAATGGHRGETQTRLDPGHPRKEGKARTEFVLVLTPLTKVRPPSLPGHDHEMRDRVQGAFKDRRETGLKAIARLLA